MYDIRNFTDEETLLAQSLAGLCARQRPLILKGSQYGTSKTSDPICMHARNFRRCRHACGRITLRWGVIHHAAGRQMDVICHVRADVVFAAFASLQAIYNVTIQPVNTIAQLLASVAAANMMPTCYVEYSTFQVRPVIDTTLFSVKVVTTCQGVFTVAMAVTAVTAVICAIPTMAVVFGLLPSAPCCSSTRPTQPSPLPVPLVPTAW